MTHLEILCPHCLGYGDFTVMITESPNPHRYILGFGKYKGKRIGDITDESYLRWIMTSATDGDYKDVLLAQCAEAQLTM
jgi:hypothetical protein